MGKNKSASGLTNFVQYDNQGNIFFVSGSNTLMSISSSGAITTTGVISGSNALSSSYAVSSSFATFATNTTTAATASSVGTLNQNVTITGSLTTTGQIVAQTLNVQQVTSSIVYSSGSNIFGNSQSNIQQMTGSLSVTGSGTFSSTVDGTIINSTSNAFRLNGNNALSLVTLNGQSVVKINAAGFWGTQLVGANDQGIVINNTGQVGIGNTSPSNTLTISSGDGTFVKYGTNGYLGQYSNGAYVIGGAEFNSGGSWTARHTSAASIVANNAGDGSIIFNTNTGLTSGTTFGTTERVRITPTGSLLVNRSTTFWPTIKSVEINGPETILGMTNGSTSLGYLYHSGTHLYVSNERTGVSGLIVFNNDGAEKMRITSGTDVWVNTTGNYGTTTLSVRSAWSAGSYGQIQFYTGTGNATVRSSVPGNSTNGIQILTYSAASGDKITANFDGAGNVYNYNNTTTWQQTSDVRVKENINTISNALDTLTALNPVTFDYKQEFADKNSWNEDKKLNNIGFIAQEFETVFPKYVHSIQDKVGDQTIEDFKSIDTGHLIPYLVKAIQELKAEFDAYKATHP